MAYDRNEIKCITWIPNDTSKNGYAVFLNDSITTLQLLTSLIVGNFNLKETIPWSYIWIPTFFLCSHSSWKQTWI